MKNIHILPTEKSSRLWINKLLQGKLELSKEFLIGNNTAQNIYITSNKDINENDYIITKDGRLVQVSYLLSKDLEDASKVILTTDQDLIKDGVQAIDDEFLEWFVKNPSCKKVQVDKFVSGRYFITNTITPKEEPKPHSFCETPDEKCTMNYCDENGCQNRKRELVELNQQLERGITITHIGKQGTLEEAAKERYGSDQFLWAKQRDGFVEGAKWQKEQDKKMYSEEDMKLAYIQGCKNPSLHKTHEEKAKEWFEQFKKK